jgi:hypothetical protein
MGNPLCPTPEYPSFGTEAVEENVPGTFTFGAAGVCPVGVALRMASAVPNVGVLGL